MQKRSQCRKIIIFLVLFVVNVCGLFSQDKTVRLNKEDKLKFIEKVSTLLNNTYVFPEIAAQIEKHLKSKNLSGLFDKIDDPKEFAETMTREMQSVSHDKHMRVRVRPEPAIKAEKPDLELERVLGREAEKELNYGFVKVEVLKGNIGYVDFRQFAQLSTGKDAASAAMKFLNNTFAIIFDLRKNGGGNPDMIQYICSYFFDKPTHLNSIYWRKDNRTIEFWTHDKIDGRKMPDIPLYVLTSNYTFSGAEEFSYNMQTRKRATLIGEITGGGANPGTLIPVDRTFGIFIPTGRAINPVTGTNWEGTGVKPDILVPADKALDAALEKASIEAEKFKLSRKNELVNGYKASKNKIDKAEKLFEDKNNEEAEKLVYSGLGIGLNNGIFDENYINNAGYFYLEKNNFGMAISFFKFNVSAFPKSANAYDSLGEAYLKNGEKDLAIINYKKSLELNPENKSAREVLNKINAK